MEEKPRRRTRRRAAGAPTFPIVPAVLVVLVGGFFIGAALSLFGNRNGGAQRPAATPGAPLAAAVRSPAASEARKESPTEHLAVTKRPATLIVYPPATAAPLAAAAAVLSASPSPPSAASSPASVSATQVEPSSPPSPPEAPAATPTPAGFNDYADGDFARLSAGVVRAYLGALMRGDEESAYAAFGASPGDRGVSLSEQDYIDAKTQIVRVDARQTGTDAATVDVTLKTSKGPYFAQYFLKRSPNGAALITQHELIQP
jgi:hypothetical protein